jgi:putative peptidoglycan lipid II flippase
MRLALLIVVPAAAGLIVLAGPLIATLFFGGIFDEHSVAMTTLALRAYAVGLVGFSFVKILAPAFFAREDTRTPVRVGLIALGANLLLSVSSAWYLTAVGFAGPHVGLAAATSTAAILNAVLLYRGLRKDEVIRHSSGWLFLMARIAVANVAMCAVLFQLYRPLAWWLGVATLDRVYWLTVSVVAGAATYFLALLVLGMRPSQFRLRAT